MTPGRSSAATWLGQVRNADAGILRLACFVGIALVAGVMLGRGRFLSPDNLQSMAFQLPELAMLSLAMLVVMLPGGIDLSVVAVANLSGIVAASVMTHRGSSGLEIVAGCGLGLLCGATCGALNGWLVARARISPILATLGTMHFLTGVATVVTGGRAIVRLPDFFLTLGNGTLWGAPLSFVALVAIALVTWIVTSRTAFGLRLRLVGANRLAAHFSGIRTGSVVLWAHVAAGTLAGLTGILMAARTASAKADYGSSYLLQAILVVVLGGVRSSGGFGSVVGVVLALLALQLLSSIFGFLRFSNFSREFAWGLFLLTAMVLNHWSDSRKRQAKSADCTNLGTNKNEEVSQ